MCGSLCALMAQTETTSFDVDGIKVIFKPTLKQVINVRMYYRGGVTNYPASEAGIESFALQATVECGTKKYGANAFKDLADKYSINFATKAQYDYGDIEMDCVSSYFNDAWDLFTEAVVNPVFDSNEIELLRDKMFVKIKQKQSNADSHVDQILLNSAFKGTPYAADPDGDDAVVLNLTANEIKAYYNSILNKNQMYIVVAGKISKDELIAKIKASFGTLPAKPYQAPTLQEPVWNDYDIISESRNLSTNYINGIMNSPVISSADYVPFRVGMSAIGGALFQELRTRLSLSYSPGAKAVMQQMPYAMVYVSTTKPKEAVTAITDILTKVFGYRLANSSLKQIKNSYITSMYIKQQNTSSITESLGQAEALGGWQLAEDLPQLIDKVNVNQISAALSKYIQGIRWGYLGNIKQGQDAVPAFRQAIR